MEWRRFVTYLWNDPRTTAYNSANNAIQLTTENAPSKPICYYYTIKS